MEKKLLATLVLTLISGAALAAGADSRSSSDDAASRAGSASASTDTAMFDRLDADKDGTLSRSEFNMHVQEMARMKRGPGMQSGKRDRMSGSESDVSGAVENDASANDPGKAAPMQNEDRLGVPEGSR